MLLVRHHDRLDGAQHGAERAVHSRFSVADGGTGIEGHAAGGRMRADPCRGAPSSRAGVARPSAPSSSPCMPERPTPCSPAGRAHLRGRLRRLRTTCDAGSVRGHRTRALYPTAVELEECTPRDAQPQGSTPPRPGTRASCPSRRSSARARCSPENGRCRIYASRPLGCRTFFCQTAEPPYGARLRAPPRRGERHRPAHRGSVGPVRVRGGDPHPRALTKSLG